MCSLPANIASMPPVSIPQVPLQPLEMEQQEDTAARARNRAAAVVMANVAIVDAGTKIKYYDFLKKQVPLLHCGSK